MHTRVQCHECGAVNGVDDLLVAKIVVDRHGNEQTAATCVDRCRCRDRRRQRESRPATLHSNRAA